MSLPSFRGPPRPSATKASPTSTPGGTTISTALDMTDELGQTLQQIFTTLKTAGGRPGLQAPAGSIQAAEAAYAARYKDMDIDVFACCGTVEVDEGKIPAPRFLSEWFDPTMTVDPPTEQPHSLERTRRSRAHPQRSSGRSAGRPGRPALDPEEEPILASAHFHRYCQGIPGTMSHSIETLKRDPRKDLPGRIPLDPVQLNPSPKDFYGNSD